MRYAHHIGRIGALAVALGIGAAATTPSPAWADPAVRASTSSAEAGAAGTSSERTDAADEKRPGSASTPRTGTDSGTTSGADTTPGTDTAPGTGTGTDTTSDTEPPDTEAPDQAEPDAQVPSVDMPDDTPDDTPDDEVPIVDLTPEPGTDVSAPPPAGPRVPPTADTGGGGTPMPRSAVDLGTTSAAVVDPPPASSFAAATTQAAAARVAPIVTPVVTRPVALPPPTPAEVVAGLPGAVAAVAASLVTLVATPFAVLPGLLGVPGAPPPDTALWLVLAAARRQLFNSTPTLTPTATSTDPGTGLLVGNVGGTDADGDPLAYTVVQGPARGTLTLDPRTGAYVYTPAAGTAGADTFVVAVSDGGSDGLFGFLAPARGHTSVASITLTVAPLAADPSFTLGDAEPTRGAVAGRIDVTGVGSPGVTTTLSAAPTRGAVVLGADGTFVYAPTPIARAFAAYTAATDTFTVTVSAGVTPPVVVTVAVPVSASNNALVYQVPIGQFAGASTASFYRFERPMVLDPLTGRLLGVEIFIDRENRDAGGSPTFARIVAVQTDGTVALSESLQIQSAQQVVISPTTGTAFLLSGIVDAEGRESLDVTRLTADGRTLTGSFAGRAEGVLTADPRTGRVYLLRTGVGDTAADASRLDTFDAAGVLLDSAPIAGSPVGGVTLDPSTGRVFVTSQTPGAAPGTSNTVVTVVTGAGATRTHTVEGTPRGGVVLNPVTGAALQLSVSGRGVGRVVVLTGIDIAGDRTEVLRYRGAALGGVAVDTATGVAYVPVSRQVSPGEPPSITVLRVGADGTVDTAFAGTGFAEGPVVVNSRTGNAHLLVLAPDFSGYSVATFGAGTSRIERFPGGAPRLTVDPAVSIAVVTSTADGVPRLSVVGPDGVLRTVTGRLVGSPVVDPTRGVTLVTTREGDFLAGSASLSIVSGDGTLVRTVDLGGFPTNPPVVDTVSGVVYQEVIDFSSASLGDGPTVVRVGLDGTVTRVALRSPSSFDLNVFEGRRFTIIPNPVTGQAYLIVADRLETPENRAVYSVAVISADGTQVDYVGPGEAAPEAIGRPLGNVVINPVTGAAYLSTASFGATGLVARVLTLFGGASAISSDALPSQDFVSAGLVVDPATGTVYQTTSDGVWIVDVDPNRDTGTSGSG